MFFAENGTGIVVRLIPKARFPHYNLIRYEANGDFIENAYCVSVFRAGSVVVKMVLPPMSRQFISHFERTTLAAC